MKGKICITVIAVVLVFLAGCALGIYGDFGKKTGKEDSRKTGQEMSASSQIDEENSSGADASVMDDLQEADVKISGSASCWDYETEQFSAQTEEAALTGDYDDSLDTDALFYEAEWDGLYDAGTGTYDVNTYSLKLQLLSGNEADLGKTVTLLIAIPDILKDVKADGETYYPVSAAVSAKDEPVYTELEGLFERKEKISGVGRVWRDEEGNEKYSDEEVRLWEHQYNVWKWEPSILEEYQSYYQANHDIIGWLSIEGSSIDGPVMQTLEDEDYYLHRDFNGNDSEEGTLFVSSFCDYGVGLQTDQYEDGEKPTTNCIIYGHNMKNGTMFGTLDKYESQDYEKEHSMITFNTLYETRTYQVMCVFRSQIYDDSYGEDVFRYYGFYQADTEEEFDDWYDNIESLSLYDTGVTAEFGDEFITLSTCAYHVKDGRFAVVAKRVS